MELKMESPPSVYTNGTSHEFVYHEPDSLSLPLGKEYKLKMVNMNGIDIAAFNVDGEDLLCFPQVYEYFLKDLVSGMHTVYTKLKRMNIQGRNCNVEQVRMMRSVGAIGQVVNRCKLISREDFNKIYEDCLLYRGPGRRRKNPEIPPELLNNPFKIYRTDTQQSPGQAETVPGSGQEDNGDEVEQPTEQRDSNNNSEDNAFKVPHRHVVHSAVPRFTGASNGYISSSHSGVFAYNSRTPSSSRLPTMVNIRSSVPQTNSSPAISNAVHITHTPVRSLMSETQSEQSVSHVSSTGVSEHVENRGIVSEAGSDLSASTARIHLKPEVEYRENGSVETLLHNIQGLLKVTAESARQQQRQAQLESNELRRLLQREKDAREKAEKLSASLQRSKAFWHKKFKREKKAKKKLSERLAEEQQRVYLLDQQLQNTSQDAMKQMNDSLIEELDKERSAKGEAERKLQARGEIQNFMQNFLENPRLVQTQQKQATADQFEMEVKEEQESH
ncbi:dachshund homolog 1 isoform X2 [Exaiptasia diaphana]|uniref:SKI/SNO/DAC domain-containing protein n=1 Tax=Exaiptasia diaphana TaxID=2652724 RepID=A0A913YC61_EXADI|nr:dachshund homolog 1 isoform X2 [Exaiptasia diaphana]